MIPVNGRCARPVSCDSLNLINTTLLGETMYAALRKLSVTKSSCRTVLVHDTLLQQGD
ncbi:hypothetical protein HVPorG_04639 [Roseomonas mucosa]|nr:hypothetical protein HVPorG_04639 [Roseomonas mucosa]